MGHSYPMGVGITSSMGLSIRMYLLLSVYWGNNGLKRGVLDLVVL